MSAPQDTGARNERHSIRSGVRKVAAITATPIKPIVPQIARSARRKRSLSVIDPRLMVGTRSFEKAAFHVRILRQCGDTDVPYSFEAASSKERQRQSHTGKPIFTSVPLVLTFVKAAAATGYECQNRDTSNEPFADR